MYALRQIIIIIGLVAAVAFLGISIISAWQIFTLAVGASEIRGELWLLLVLAFLAGSIMLAIGWGISEMSEIRRNPRPTPPTANAGEDE